MDKIGDDYIKQNKINPERQTLWVPDLFFWATNQFQNCNMKTYS